MLFTWIIFFLPIMLTISTADQQQHRFRRFINVLTDQQTTELVAKHGSTINIAVGGKTDAVNEKVRDPWLHMVKNQTGRIMEGGTDLVLTPINWLTNMTNYW